MDGESSAVSRYRDISAGQKSICDTSLLYDDCDRTYIMCVIMHGLLLFYNCELVNHQQSVDTETSLLDKSICDTSLYDACNRTDIMCHNNTRVSCYYQFSVN
jgi:hypothetical protein